MIPASHLHTLSILPSFVRLRPQYIFFFSGKKRAKSAPPLKGILKTNHHTKQAEVAQNFTAEVITWPPMAAASPSLSTCCCCPTSGLNDGRGGHTVMHPDDPERNYVSHCHTENRLWRPDAVVIHHRDSTASKQPQLQDSSFYGNSRVKHNQIYTSCERSQKKDNFS